MLITLPGLLKFSPMIGFGIVLLTKTVVGEAFRSTAPSPGAHPGKPPLGTHRPAVCVQFADGGGALAVTVYAVGTQTLYAVAAPMTSTTRRIAKETRNLRMCPSERRCMGVEGRGYHRRSDVDDGTTCRSQLWFEYAGDPLFQSFDCRPLEPAPHRDLARAREVFEEHRLHLFGDAAVVHVHVHFIVQAKRSLVEIR